MKSPLVRAQSDQSRHLTRGLVISNEQPATLSGMVLASTRRTEAISLSNFVINRLFNQLNNLVNHVFAGVLIKKMALGSGRFISVNRP